MSNTEKEITFMENTDSGPKVSCQKKKKKTFSLRQSFWNLFTINRHNVLHQFFPPEKIMFCSMLLNEVQYHSNIPYN